MVETKQESLETGIGKLERLLLYSTDLIRHAIQWPARATEKLVAATES